MGTGPRGCRGFRAAVPGAQRITQQGLGPRDAAPLAVAESWPGSGELFVVTPRPELSVDAAAPATQAPGARSCCGQMLTQRAPLKITVFL